MAKRSDGHPLVAGKRVTGFTNSEEASVNLTKVVPFLFEDELTARGATFVGKTDWQPSVVTDGTLVTGQNPMSAVPAAKAVIEMIKDMHSF